MNFSIIKTEKEYKKALKRFEIIFDAKKSSPEGNEAEMLALLIENYENEHYFIDAPNPIAAIKFRMEQMDLSQNDLAKIIGYKSRVSEILKKKRKLTLDMIRKLSEYLNIPAEVLVREY